MSSTNFGSILIFASCVIVGTCNIHYNTMWVSFFLMEGVLFFSLIFIHYMYGLYNMYIFCFSPLCMMVGVGIL